MALMLSCREMDDFLGDYLEGALGLRTRLTFGMHMALCRPCRVYVDTYRHTVAACGRAFEQPDDPVPADVPEDLVRAVLRARSS